MASCAGLLEDPVMVPYLLITALFGTFGLGLAMLFETETLREAFVGYFVTMFLLFFRVLSKAWKLSSSLITGAGS
jgi:hypothetical protein